MTALRMEALAAKALPLDNRHRPLCSQQGSVCDAVTPNDRGLSTWGALRVLIVDDEQGTMGGLFDLVEAWGHAVQVAYPGQATVIAAADRPPDVVLLNLDLPFVGGRNLAGRLRLDALQTDCLIIAVADRADDERRRQCSEAGIDLLLVSPLDPSVLEVLLGLECVRMNRQRAAEAGNRQIVLRRGRVNHVDRNA